MQATSQNFNLVVKITGTYSTYYGTVSLLCQSRFVNFYFFITEKFSFQLPVLF